MWKYIEHLKAEIYNYKRYYTVSEEDKEFVYRMRYNEYEQIKIKIQKKQRVEVGFFLVSESAFAMKGLYDLLAEDEKFLPYILVIPDMIHGNENMLEQMERTYSTLMKTGRNVKKAFDEKQNKFIDFSSDTDLVCITNPYDCLTHDFYKIEYLAGKGILTFYSAYGYGVSKWWEKMFDTPEYNLLWKNFADNKLLYRELLTKTFMQARNAKCVGYSKMDEMSGYYEKDRKRKKIIIASHHTILEGEISFSTFLSYADFFLELPDIFPQVDFVFRPHPLLRAQLLEHSIWSKERIEEYFEKLESKNNVEYQKGGNYLEIFVNSDAIIHDCGSFMAEYLFTDHPACFLLKDEEHNNRNFNDFAQKCIACHYPAHNKKEIISFIQETVIEEKDFMKAQRIKFAKDNIRINYPNATETIYHYIKKELKK